MTRPRLRKRGDGSSVEVRWPPYHGIHEKTLTSPNFLLKLLTVSFFLSLLSVGIEKWSRTVQVTAQTAQIQDSIRNKIFTHNRTSAVTMALAQKNLQDERLEKMEKKKRVPGRFKGQKPVGGLPKLNIERYLKMAVNMLRLGLGPRRPSGSAQGPTTLKNLGEGENAELSSTTPTLPSTLHPLSVLRTEMTSSESSTNISNNIEGRSNFEFEPLFESSYGQNNGSSGSVKDLDSGYFDNFEDQLEDPIAQESGLNSFSVIDPNFPKPPGLTMFRPKVKLSRPNFRHGHYPSANGNEVNKKHVKYWPNNLNSYYGIQKPVVRYPSNGNYHIAPPHRPYGHGSHYDGTKLEEDDELDAQASSLESESILSYKKATFMERVSVFYSEYKVLAWVVVAVVAALAVLGVIIGLYLSNPPTEVVTARKQLARALEDPRLLTFLNEYRAGSSNFRMPFLEKLAHLQKRRLQNIRN